MKKEKDLHQWTELLVPLCAAVIIKDFTLSYLFSSHLCFTLLRLLSLFHLSPVVDLFLSFFIFILFLFFHCILLHSLPILQASEHSFLHSLTKREQVYLANTVNSVASYFFFSTLFHHNVSFTLVHFWYFHLSLYIAFSLWLLVEELPFFFFFLTFSRKLVNFTVTPHFVRLSTFPLYCWGACHLFKNFQPLTLASSAMYKWLLSLSLSLFLSSRCFLWYRGKITRAFAIRSETNFSCIYEKKQRRERENGENVELTSLCVNECLLRPLRVSIHDTETQHTHTLRVRVMFEEWRPLRQRRRRQ